MPPNYYISVLLNMRTSNSPNITYLIRLTRFFTHIFIKHQCHLKGVVSYKTTFMCLNLIWVAESCTHKFTATLYSSTALVCSNSYQPARPGKQPRFLIEIRWPRHNPLSGQVVRSTPRYLLVAEPFTRLYRVFMLANQII